MDLDPSPLDLKLSENRKAHDVAMLRRAMRTKRPRRRWTKRTTLVGASAFIVVGGGVAATAAIVQSPRAATDVVTARCYSSVSSNFGGSFPGTSVGSADSPAGPTPGTISQSVFDDCATAWRMGVLVAGADTAQAGNNDATNPVPTLTACVLPSGQAAVFPGPASTCQQLGISPLQVAGRVRSR